jgi:hypothetical protein
MISEESPREMALMDRNEAIAHLEMHVLNRSIRSLVADGT